MQVLNAGWSAPFNITESAIDLAITAQKIKKDQQMKMVLLLLQSNGTGPIVSIFIRHCSSCIIATSTGWIKYKFAVLRGNTLFM
jgi:hypothetical protein